jgi:hypothetical protein
MLDATARSPPKEWPTMIHELTPTAMRMASSSAAAWCIV